VTCLSAACHLAISKPGWTRQKYMCDLYRPYMRCSLVEALATKMYAAFLMIDWVSSRRLWCGGGGGFSADDGFGHGWQ
jgi:hypothetical protein